MNAKFQALNEAEDGGRSIEFFGNNEPLCPHCGLVVDVADHELWKLYEEGEHDVSCPHCDEDFMVSTSVSYSFSTDNQETP